MAFYTSTEFYVLSAVAAAVIVGLCVKPSDRGEARQHLLSGTLLADGCSSEPMIEIEVTDDSTVVITRRGLRGLVNPDGAASIVVNVVGLDVSIEERLTPGRAIGDDDNAPDVARFELDFLGNERYHIKYVADLDGAVAAMPLNVRPGIKTSRKLA